MNVDQALADPNLLGAGLGSDAASWVSWRAVLRATYGLPLDDEQAATFSGLAGGRKAPQNAVSEFWAIVGRRSGKSRMAALVAVYEAVFAGHERKLAPGETGIVAVVSASKWQARAIRDYAAGFLRSSPILAQLVRSAGAEEISLNNGISIEVRSGNFRTVRGRTLVCAVLDEVAYWRSEESRNPDVETYRAILPALATTGGRLIGISSPYRKAGLLWQKHRDHHGQDDPDVIVIQAASEALNPTLDPAIIKRARESDPEAAVAEWDGQFRNDIAGFVDRAAVLAVTESGVTGRSPSEGLRYRAFCDPSGGSSDSMTLAVAHREGDMAVLDALREVKAPFSPPAVVYEFALLLRFFGIRQVYGDRYGAEWVAESFRQHSIGYVSPLKNRSEIYLELLPLINAGQCRLLDNERLQNQLCGLERRVSAAGRDLIDHAPGSHDDLANAAAGALVLASPLVPKRAGVLVGSY